MSFYPLLMTRLMIVQRIQISQHSVWSAISIQSKLVEAKVIIWLWYSVESLKCTIFGTNISFQKRWTWTSFEWHHTTLLRVLHDVFNYISILKASSWHTKNTQPLAYFSYNFALLTAIKASEYFPDKYWTLRMISYGF